MDEIVLVFGFDPIVLEVVDEEVNILRDEVGLNRRQVDTDDLGVGVLVTNWIGHGG